MNDAISRIALLRKTRPVQNLVVKRFGDEWQVEMVTLEDIIDAPALNVAPVVHDWNTSFVSVEDVDEWKDRIVLDEGEKTKRCKVYYAGEQSTPARWKDHTCTRCKKMCLKVITPQGQTVFVETPHCPSCGARMDGECDEE